MKYDHYFDDEQYDDYADGFDPLRNDRQARRKRKPKTHHVPKKSQEDVIEMLAEETDLETSFETTYQPSPFEEGWLLSSLKPFYMMGFITDVLAQVKGGKEASVYRCEMHAEHGGGLVAAKVYRPRKFRNLRNDKMYREGRVTLKSDGKEVKATDQRIMRALNKKSAYGDEVAHTSWLMYEYTTMKRLYEVGANIPKPIYNSSNAILMEYIGDAHIAAPILNSVNLDSDEVKPLFNIVLRNIDLMLQLDLIHGDLSAYNILYWEGEIRLIDFPQVTNIHTNSNAYFILKRDIERICDYFAGQGLKRDPQHLTDKLWRKYSHERPRDVEADMSRYEVTDEDDDYDDEFDDYEGGDYA